MIISRECHPLSQVTNWTWGPLLHLRSQTISQIKKSTTEFILRIPLITLNWRPQYTNLLWGAPYLYSLTYRVVSTTLKFSDSISVGVCAFPFRSLPLSVPSVSNDVSLGDTKYILFKILNRYYSSVSNIKGKSYKCIFPPDKD